MELDGSESLLSVFAGDTTGWQYDVDGLEVIDGEFTVATAHGADHPFHEPLVSVLARIRAAMKLDIVFVAPTLHGAPALRTAGSAMPVIDEAETEFGGLVLRAAGVAGGELLSQPVQSKDGTLYGCVCCLAKPAPGSVSPADALASVARMAAYLLSRAEPEEREAMVWQSSAAAPLALD